MNVYVLKDIVKAKVISISLDDNDEDAVRNNARYFMPLIPMTDLELYRVGHIEDGENQIETEIPKKIEWNIYNFHENKAAALKVFKKNNEPEELDNEEKGK